MPNWFRKGLSPHHTALAMVGAKSGDRVVVIGADDPALAAEVARVTALTGQTLVSDPHEGAEDRVNAAAVKAGTLVEFTPAAPAALPLENASQDIAVVMTPLTPLETASRARLIAEAVRVLRPGGRLLIVDGEHSSGLLGGFRRSRPQLPRDTVLALLDAAGMRARRQLADVEGVAFYEGRKAGE